MNTIHRAALAATASLGALAASALGAPVAVETVLFTGDAAPDASDAVLGGAGTNAVLDTLDEPVRLSDGTIAFTASTTDSTGIVREGVFFRLPDGTVRRVLTEGEVDGMSAFGSPFAEAFNEPAIDADGTIVFEAELTGPPNTAGGDPAESEALVVALPDGTRRILARSGDAVDVPGGAVLGETSSDGSFRDAFDNEVDIAGGRVLFQSDITPQDPDGPDEGLFVADEDGAISVLVLPGADVSNVAGGVLEDLDGGTINEVGIVVFEGDLLRDDESELQNGIDTANNDGIFTLQDGQLTMIAREADVVDASDGARLDGVFGDPVLNEAGQVAFTAGLEGDDLNGGTTDLGEGLVLATTAGGAPTLLVRTGDAVDGGVIEDIDGDLSLNEVGTVAFLADLESEDGLFDLGEALFTVNPDGVLHEILREGDFLEVRGQSREVVGLDIALDSLSDDGVLSFVANFADGTSALLLANLDPVPVPGAALLLLTGLGGGAALRRRRSASR